MNSGSNKQSKILYEVGSKINSGSILNRFYDEDDSGSIELEEMCKVLSNIYQAEGLPQVFIKNKHPQKFKSKIFQKDATTKAKELFEELDIDRSGEIDKEEFLQGLLTDIQSSDVPKVTVEHVDQRKAEI